MTFAIKNKQQQQNTVMWNMWWQIRFLGKLVMQNICVSQHQTGDWLLVRWLLVLEYSVTLQMVQSNYLSLILVYNFLISYIFGLFIFFFLLAFVCLFTFQSAKP